MRMLICFRKRKCKLSGSSYTNHNILFAVKLTHSLFFFYGNGFYSTGEFCTHRIVFV
jgi:hypothetical protein